MDGWTDGQFIKFWAPCTAPWCLGHTYVLILQQLTHFLSSVIFLFPLSVLCPYLSHQFLWAHHSCQFSANW
jgi:hypothetical protein